MIKGDLQVHRNKKRSLRGKFFLSITYLIILCIFICFTKSISSVLLNNKTENKSNSTKINDVRNNNQTHKNKKEAKENYTDEIKLVKNIMKLILSVPFEKNTSCSIQKNGMVKTIGLDSYGLVDFTYACATGKHLSTAGINEKSLEQCKEITQNDLHIGDIGVCKFSNSNIYGIFIGYYGSHPLFVYASDLSNGIYESGSVYISYNKTDCNDIFAGMFPIAYSKYYRLPGMIYKSTTGSDIIKYLPANIIPSQKYSEYASAVYRVGEWFLSNDYNNLVNRLSDKTLIKNGYELDRDAYTTYISNYGSNTGADYFLFRIVNYSTFKNYTTVHSEIIINDSNTDRTFLDSGQYFDCTIYKDGNYLPGYESNLRKSAFIYGFKKIQNNSSGADQNIKSNIEAGKEVKETERYIKGDGFTIDKKSLEK